MEPLDELLSWTDAQIEVEVASHVEEGLEFVCEWRDGVWSARIEAVASPDAIPRVLHAVENVDRRMALYDIYGYLWLRNHVAPAGSRWDATTPRPTIVSVTQQVHGRVADPEDVDPDEVAAVYGIPRSKKDVE